MGNIESHSLEEWDKPGVDDLVRDQDVNVTLRGSNLEKTFLTDEDEDSRRQVDHQKEKKTQSKVLDGPKVKL